MCFPGDISFPYTHHELFLLFPNSILNIADRVRKKYEDVRVSQAGMCDVIPPKQRGRRHSKYSSFNHKKTHTHVVVKVYL